MIAAGIAAAIPTYLEALPHLLPKHPPPALTITPSSDNIMDRLPSVKPVPTDLCQLGGTYIIRRSIHLARTLSTGQLVALIKNADAIDINSTSGEYTLQAAPNETVVITAIHTILVNRVPAPHATVINVDAGDSCGTGGGTTSIGSAMPIYHVGVNLDGADVKPKVRYYSGLTELALIYGLQTRVTHSSPSILVFKADTKKFEVTWKFQIYYTFNGQQETAWIKNGPHPFRTEAELSDDTHLDVTLNSERAWMVTEGS